MLTTIIRTLGRMLIWTVVKESVKVTPDRGERRRIYTYIGIAILGVILLSCRPEYRFTTDSTTGFYRFNDTLRFASAGHIAYRCSFKERRWERMDTTRALDTLITVYPGTLLRLQVGARCDTVFTLMMTPLPPQ